MDRTKYLTITALARLLHRHPDTIRDLVNRQAIPAPLRDPITGWRLWTIEMADEALRRIAPQPEAPCT